MILFLQPNDTFFFRDGRPFTKGDQSEGYSIFPPLPSTILGALRTAYIAEHGDLPSFDAGKMEKTIGTSTPNSLGSMHLNGVFLADRKSGLYFPIPLDLVMKKNERENMLYPLEVCPNNSNLRSNASPMHLLRWNGPEDVETETSGKLKPLYMKEYLLGKHKTFRFSPQENFICDEPKIGIQRSRETLTSEDSMLYRINMSRFQSRFQDMSELGFAADYQCHKVLPSKGLLKLGGEGKSFIYELSELDVHNPNPFPTEGDLDKLKNAITDSAAFKLYFATPAIFENGWLPKWIDKTTRCGHYLPSGTDWIPTHPVSIQLVTTAVGKSIPIGGWDMKNRMPKPTLRAVPAGSVYYFKMLDGCCVDKIINVFHYQNISDYQAKEGYGLCFVGVAEGDKL